MRYTPDSTLGVLEQAVTEVLAENHAVVDDVHDGGDLDQWVLEYADDLDVEIALHMRCYTAAIELAIKAIKRCNQAWREGDAETAIVIEWGLENMCAAPSDLTVLPPDALDAALEVNRRITQSRLAGDEARAMKLESALSHFLCTWLTHHRK